MRAGYRQAMDLLYLACASLAGAALRVNHTGRRATLPSVWSALGALARGLGVLGHDPDLANALSVATSTWYASAGPGPTV